MIFISPPPPSPPQCLPGEWTTPRENVRYCSSLATLTPPPWQFLDYYVISALFRCFSRSKCPLWICIKTLKNQSFATIVPSGRFVNPKRGKWSKKGKSLSYVVESHFYYLMLWFKNYKRKNFINITRITSFYKTSTTCKSETSRLPAREIVDRRPRLSRQSVRLADHLKCGDPRRSLGEAPSLLVTWDKSAYTQPSQWSNLDKRTSHLTENLIRKEIFLIWSQQIDNLTQINNDFWKTPSLSPGNNVSDDSSEVLQNLSREILSWWTSPTVSHVMSSQASRTFSSSIYRGQTISSLTY